MSKKRQQNQTPRTTDEITREYGQKAAQAGALQYQILILQEELKSLNEIMRTLNREGHLRKLLDAKTLPQTQGTEVKLPEASNEQTQ